MGHWMRPEGRTQPYTDAIVQRLIDQAAEQLPAEGMSSGVEIAAGVVARAFASAEVTGPPPVQDLGPDLMAALGRDLVTYGEALLVRHGGRIRRAKSWEVYADRMDAAAWAYQVRLPMPSGDTLQLGPLAAGMVAHPRMAPDAARPWEGVAPWRRAVVAADMAAHIERSLRSEASAKVGYLLPVPAAPAADGQEDRLDALKSSLKSLKGNLALVETTQAGWDQGRVAAPQAEWQPKRLGAAPPEAVVTVFSRAQETMLALCGVPVELVRSSQGTASREAWRRCLHGTLMPMGRTAARELSGIAGGEVRIRFDGLMASDLSGRARAFQSMVHGGMDLQQAAALSGLMEPDGTGEGA